MRTLRLNETKELAQCHYLGGETLPAMLRHRPSAADWHPPISLRPGLRKVVLPCFTVSPRNRCLPEPPSGCLREACLAPRAQAVKICLPADWQPPETKAIFRTSLKYREGRARSGEGHGTFSREMMLPERLWLFITPGKCGLCYFLIRLVRGRKSQPPGCQWIEHLTADL